MEEARFSDTGGGEERIVTAGLWDGADVAPAGPGSCAGAFQPRHNRAYGQIDGTLTGH